MCGRRRRRSFESAGERLGSFLGLGISSSACASRRNMVPEKVGVADGASGPLSDRERPSLRNRSSRSPRGRSER